MGVGAGVVGLAWGVTFTVNKPAAFTKPNLAVTLVVPTAKAEPVPKASKVATVVFELVQV